MQSDEPAENETLLRGRVVDGNGNPIAGCHLAVLGDNRVHFPHTQVVFAETVSDVDGRYQFSLQKEPLHKFASIRVVAHAEGMGWAWMDFSHNEPQLEILFTLTAEQPIRGRLLDGEAQPAIGITLRPFAVVQSVQEDGRDMYFPTVDKQSAALPQPVQTDDEGRFVIANIPSGHGVRLFSNGPSTGAIHLSDGAELLWVKCVFREAAFLAKEFSPGCSAECVPFNVAIFDPSNVRQCFEGLVKIASVDVKITEGPHC